MMKYAFKVLIIFLIIFNFRLPVIYNSVILAVLLTVAYYFYERRSIPFTYFNSRYIVTIVIATFILCLLNLFVLVTHEAYSNILYIQRLVLQLFMICSMVFAYPILIEDKSHAFEDAAAIICWAFAAQGAIHLSGFLYEPLGNFLFDMKPAGFKEFMLRPDYNIDRFRAYALTGSIFLELPSAYGAASVMFFRLMLIKNQKYFVGWRSFLVFFLYVAGVALSGRTGFIGLGIGIGYYLVFTPKNNEMWKNAGKVAWACCVLLFAFYFLLPGKQRNSMIDDVFPFAFEFYYNYRDEGTLSTSSTDVTTEVHYYPLRSETWAWGHGISADDIPYYRHTDSGYMDAIIFGGISYLLALIIFQYVFFMRPLAIAWDNRDTKESQNDFWCLLLLFLYLYIIEYKGAALGTQHITETMFAFLCLSYLERHYYREDHGLQEKKAVGLGKKSSRRKRRI